MLLWLGSQKSDTALLVVEIVERTPITDAKKTNKHITDVGRVEIMECNSTEVGRREWGRNKKVGWV